MNAVVTRIARLEASLDSAGPETHDRARWDWYAESCACGVPAGSCRLHPRARPAQRPPEGDWRAWLALAGRGWAKSRCGGEWIRYLVENAQARRVALIAPKAADVRDVMAEGESGLPAIYHRGFGRGTNPPSGREILDYPEGPQHPHEDLMDALRGGIRDVFPKGRRLVPARSTVRARRLF
jgi:hypothetical protein